jgi:type IV secretion system protein TrbL
VVIEVEMFLFFQLGGAPPPVLDPSTLTTMYEALVPQWVGAVIPLAMDLFVALAGLDLAFFGWSLWKQYRGDITAAILSTANRLLILGLSLDLLLNGPTWFADIVNMFITVGKTGSGVGGIGPSMLLQRGVVIAGTMLGQAMVSGILTDLLTGIAMTFAALVILLSFLVITIEFVITKVQTFLAMGMGLFFLGFGGSTWTRTYVERYFSYSVSSGVRLMTLYFLIGAGFGLSQNWIALAAQAPLTAAGVLSCWIIGAGAIIYAVICWRGPAIAAGLLGGGPNLSHNEIWGAMGAAVQAGMTAALLASGVGSAAGAALAGGGGAAAVGGASMTAGATAPGAAGAGAASGAGAFGGAASQVSGALQTAGGNRNGSDGGGGGSQQFGGLDS